MTRLTKQQLIDLARYYKWSKVNYGIFGGLYYKPTALSYNHKVPNDKLNKWLEAQNEPH